MQDILPMLEAHEGVYKYSWFMNRLEKYEGMIFMKDKTARELTRFPVFMNRVKTVFRSQRSKDDFQVC